MNDKYFNQLVFTPHPLSHISYFGEGESAWLDLPNGYAISVLKGFNLPCERYEVEVYKRNKLIDEIDGYRGLIDLDNYVILDEDGVNILINKVSKYSPCFYALNYINQAYLKNKNTLFFESEILKLSEYRKKIKERKEENKRFWEEYRKRKRRIY